MQWISQSAASEKHSLQVSSSQEADPVCMPECLPITKFSIRACNFVASKLVRFENVILSPWEKLLVLEKLSYGRLSNLPVVASLGYVLPLSTAPGELLAV